MEHASTLLQLVRDASSGAHSSSLSESDLIEQIESARKQLQRAGGAEITLQCAAAAICHVTSQVLAFVVVYRPVAGQKAAASKWHTRMFLLETAVSSAWVGLASSGAGDLELEVADRGDLCSMYKRLVQLLWGAFRTPQQAYNTVAIMTRMAVLLAICWLSYDRVGKLTKVEELLNVCSDFCLSHESTKQLAKWPLFLLGMVNVVQRQEYTKALRCFQVVVENCDAVEDDGVFSYWHALVLLHNGRSDEAVAALDKCIRANFHPVACLSLQALVDLQALDYHAAAEQLQRALEIDFSHSNSLFNYALLMERMENFKAQEQLLEYALQAHGEGDKKSRSAEKKRLQPGEAADLFSTEIASTSLFNTASLAALVPSKLTKMDVSTVHLKLAEAAMENGSWQESKKHFEEFLDRGELSKHLNMAVEATRDYIYVLLQCKLPSLALSTCEQCLLEHEGCNTVGGDRAAALLMIHLYKADALLCLERVEECYQYLTQTVQPKIRDIMQRPSSASTADAITEEIAACHTQLLNNLAVVEACCNGADAGISTLREGLEQYPDCLAIKFNLVLLLWRKGEQATASSLWIKARGWNLQAESKELHSTSTAPSTNIATFPSTFRVISEHVQGSTDGQGGVSAQQLSYLDALILKYSRKMQSAQLLDKSFQYVEFLESLAPTNVPRHS